MSRHLRACRAEASRRASDGSGRVEREFFHIVAQGRYGVYWLHLEAPVRAELDDLDRFLRAVWLECCGHSSVFQIGDTDFHSTPPEYSALDAIFGPPRRQSKGMSARLAEILEPGIKFTYEYDFGSTTHLALRVVDRYSRPFTPGRTGARSDRAIRILARNDPPFIPCSHCDARAVHVCPSCLWSDGGWLCRRCGETHDCDVGFLLPVTNSPRVGVCGYDGVQDPDSERADDTHRPVDEPGVNDIDDIDDGNDGDAREEAPDGFTERRLGAMGMERALRRLERLIEAKSFDDLEEVNRYLHTAANQPEIDLGPETDPKWKAQELLWDAYAAPAPDEALRLARRALEIYPDSADAYVILAGEADSPHKAVDLLTKGVEAGERALGPELFRNQKSHFWGILETRPYMRARDTLAHALWDAGRKAEAIGHLQELLQLNPRDNLGVRYSLINWLLELQRTEAAGRLLDAFGDDPSCRWAYPKVLWRYQKEGDSRRARTALDAALASNPLVLDEIFRLLFENEPAAALADPLPSEYTLGSREEAWIYLSEGLAAWMQTEGAIDWFVDQVDRIANQIQGIRADHTPADNEKVGRNDPCPCGSGLKYKHCCLGKGTRR